MVGYQRKHFNKIMSNPIHFEIKDKKGIEALGFRYAKDQSKCRGHVFNAIPIDLDLRDLPDYKLGRIEKDLDKIFRAVLKWELRNSGIKSLREVTWDRVFFFENWWEPKVFTVKFWVRITGEDGVAEANSHVTKA